MLHDGGVAISRIEPWFNSRLHSILSDMTKPTKDSAVPEDLPRYCGRCGGAFDEPHAMRWQSIPVEPISGLSPLEYPRREGELDELTFWWYLFCKNGKCRFYQAFNLGGKFQDEGKLDPQEYEDFIHYSNS